MTIVELFAVAEFDFQALLLRFLAAEPMEVGEIDGVAGFLFVVGGGDEDLVFGAIFGDDIPRSAGEADAFALADGVIIKAVVGADFFVGVEVDEVARFCAEVGAKEVVVAEFAEEADALAIFAVLVGKVVESGEVADFRFGEVADRKDDAL